MSINRYNAYRMHANTHEARTDRTRRRLEKVAARLFGEHGFASVSAEALVEAAGVTRGALYHHYNGKEGLFATVVERHMQELHDTIRQKAASARDPWQALKLGARVFLDECSNPSLQQILFVDAPAVLGWHRWREMDARYGLGMVEQALQAATATDRESRRTATMAAHILVSAMIEAAMVIARSENKVSARREADTIIGRLLDAFRNGAK
jgi:AcrR family transcriptional regulator